MKKILSPSGNQLPHDFEAERQLLGICLLDGEQALEEINGSILPDHFFSEQHQVIYKTILEVSAQKGSIGTVTISHHLEDSGDLEKAGGVLYLTDLLESIATSDGIKYYSRIIREKAARRELIGLGYELVDLGNKSDAIVEDSLAKARLRLDEVTSTTFQHLYQDELSTWEDLNKIFAPLTWSWKGWLPNGMLTILAGEPGSGKSALALWIAATFTDGRNWPDGQPFTGDTGKVLWVECEAAQALNLERARNWKPPIQLDRFLAPLGDPMSTVRLDDQRGRSAVKAAAMRPDVQLIVVDSLRGAHRGDENSSETAGFVIWLAELARDTGKPIVLIHHVRKRNAWEVPKVVTLDRLRGSSAIVQPARVVLALDSPDRTDPNLRRLSQVKNNLSKYPSPIGLEITNTGISFKAAPEPPSPKKKIDRVQNFLRDLLRQGPVPSTEVLKAAESAGFSEKTTNRAKKQLGIQSKKKNGQWYWSLPGRSQQ